MKVIPLKHKNFDIFVLGIPFKDVNLDMCSSKFKTHIANYGPDDLIYVKCDAEGNIDYRHKAGGVTEYRVHMLSKKTLSPETARPPRRPKIPTSRITEATQQKRNGVSRDPQKITSTVTYRNKHWGKTTVKWLATLCAVLAPVPGLLLIYMNSSIYLVVGIVLLILGYEYAKLTLRKLKAK